MLIDGFRKMGFYENGFLHIGCGEMEMVFFCFFFFFSDGMVMGRLFRGCVWGRVFRGFQRKFVAMVLEVGYGHYDGWMVLIRDMFFNH